MHFRLVCFFYLQDKRLFLIPWLLVHGIMFFVVELLILIFSPLILFLIVGLIIGEWSDVF